MLSLFSSLFFVPLMMISGGDTACPDAGIDNEITIVENLDIQDWLLVEHTVEATLYGTWQKEDLTKIAIQPFPLSSNTCLVEMDNRLIPGFVFVVGEQRFLAVGAKATEQLQLQPTVYRYSFENADHSLTLIELELGDKPVACAGIEELKKAILLRNELALTNGETQSFRRI